MPHACNTCPPPPLPVRSLPVLRRLAFLLMLCLGPGLAGCASGAGQIGYYWQSARGHLQILQAAQPIDDWLARPDLSAALRTRLQLAQRARTFAVQQLHLPDNASYQRYADLGRNAAVWNVVAAPPYALTLHRWCFPVTGCIGYRGYFAEADAQAEADRMAAQGLEVEVYGVPAYSTLGYLNWAGGDPLLNTFLSWPEGDFVRLLFHELAHQVVYAADDTAFNESFATAVERQGVAQWLQQHASAATRRAYARSEARRSDFRTLTRSSRERLMDIYAQNGASAMDKQRLDALKMEAMADFRQAYAALRSQWLAPTTDGTPSVDAALVRGYDRWVERANNASFAAQAAYDDLVPAFEALWQQQGRDWPRFYDAVRALARQPQAERHAALRALAPTP